jgi:ATP-dependent Clp protease ATP-binding subunit ClpC
MADRFDKFTERARKVLQLAQEEAQRFNHNYIGTEHLLLGLVREGEGVAAKVLGNLGVELNKVRSAVEFIALLLATLASRRGRRRSSSCQSTRPAG